jgi:hypothetical protein
MLLRDFFSNSGENWAGTDIGKQNEFEMRCFWEAHTIHSILVNFCFSASPGAQKNG